LIGYDRDLNTYKEGTLRLSLVDSRQKILFGKARPQTVFIKAKMNLKLLQNLWMICSLNIRKSLIQQTSSVEIIDSLNRKYENK
jgi:hypothetical protein